MGCMTFLTSSNFFAPFHLAQSGFLGTRGSLMLDVVFLAMFAVLPLLALSIYLVKQKKYALHKLINLILGAVLTSPEVLTQMAMFVPLQILYELTVWITWYWEQPDRAKARRQLLLALLGIVLLGFLIWRYVWPPVHRLWLR